MSELGDIVLRGRTADLVIWAFRGAVAITCTVAWNMFLDVRDIKSTLVGYEKPNSSLPGSLTRREWEYEKRILLVDHELFRSEISLLRMQVDDLRGD